MLKSLCFDPHLDQRKKRKTHGRRAAKTLETVVEDLNHLRRKTSTEKETSTVRRKRRGSRRKRKKKEVERQKVKIRA